MPSCHPYIHEAEKHTMVCMIEHGYGVRDIADAMNYVISTVYRNS